MNTAPQPQTNGPATPATPPREARTPLDDLLMLDRTSSRFTLGLEPGVADEKALEDAWDIAESAAAAGLAPTADEAYARILIGRPLGIPAMASIQGIALIETKNSDGSRRTVPCMYAKLKLALLQSRKDIIEYIRPLELTSKTATWVGKRRDDEPFKYTFTIEDAQTAGLVGRGGSDQQGRRDGQQISMNNYDRHPGPMLQWRSCGRLCDILGADVLTGIATREDMEDENALTKLLEREVRSEQAAAVARGEGVNVPPPPQAKAAAAATSPAAAGAAAPAGRDFRKEADALKVQLTEAFEAKSNKQVKAFREKFDAFAKDAPAALSDEVQTFYNEHAGKVRRAQSQGGAATGAPPVPAQQPAAAPPPAQTSAAPPKSAEPPPDAGDAWEPPRDPKALPFR